MVQIQTRIVSKQKKYLLGTIFIFIPIFVFCTLDSVSFAPSKLLISLREASRFGTRPLSSTADVSAPRLVIPVPETETRQRKGWHARGGGGSVSGATLWSSVFALESVSYSSLLLLELESKQTGVGGITVRAEIANEGSSISFQQRRFYAIVCWVFVVYGICTDSDVMARRVSFGVL